MACRCSFQLHTSGADRVFIRWFLAFASVRRIDHRLRKGLGIVVVCEIALDAVGHMTRDHGHFMCCHRFQWLEIKLVVRPAHPSRVESRGDVSDVRQTFLGVVDAVDHGVRCLHCAVELQLAPVGDGAGIECESGFHLVFVLVRQISDLLGKSAAEGMAGDVDLDVWVACVQCCEHGGDVLLREDVLRGGEAEECAEVGSPVVPCFLDAVVFRASETDDGFIDGLAVRLRVDIGFVG